MDLRQTSMYLIRRGETDIGALADALGALKALELEGATYVKKDRMVSGETTIFNDDNFAAAHQYAADFRRAAKKLMKIGGRSFDAALDLYYKGHLFDAPYKFDSFCIYLEKNREKKKKFYLPRRVQLLPVVEALQDLADGKIDVLGISEPPGVGKTTIAEFYCAWFGGRDSEKTILTASHSNSLVRGMYGETLRLLNGNGGDYCFHEIFPSSPLVGTSSKDMQIDLLRRKRFSTFQYTSIGSSNAGRLRASGLLYCDDLIDGIETAMSKDRLDKIWGQYNTDLRQRKIGEAKELHIATRWSIYDPIGRLEEMYEGDERARFIRFAALDENDESNFDYPYSLGFSTQFYHEQRDIMDDASWKAIYMNQPIEREGQLYAPQELRRYFDLPEREPDGIYSVCDTKEQGSDFAVLPVAYRYGDDFYIDHFVCDDGKPDDLEEKIAAVLVEKKVDMARFESNRGGTIFAENVRKSVKEKGGKTSITTKWNQTNKQTRILVASGWVKEHCLFKDESIYRKDREYSRAMTFLTSYTMKGKNKHDDVPDALADLSDFVQGFESTKVVVMKRPF